MRRYALASLFIPEDASLIQEDMSFIPEDTSWNAVPGESGIRLLPMSAEPFVETDAAEARLAQRHEGALLDPAALSTRWGLSRPTAQSWSWAKSKMVNSLRLPARSSTSEWRSVRMAS